MLLSEVATISSGFLFRGEKRLSESEALFPVIQINDISQNNTINWENLSESALDLRRRDYILRAGDVLLRGKGFPHIATLVDTPTRDAVAGTQFFILRANTGLVLSEYLCWYINQKPAQDYLTQYSAGTNIKHINKKIISDLPVEIPSIEIQKKVVFLYNLGQQEKGLIAQILHKKDQLLQAQLLQVIKRH